MSRVCDYQTGADLAGEPSEELVRESLMEHPGRSGPGVVSAYLLNGTWHYLAVGQSPPRGTGVWTVWVEVSP